MNPNTGWMIALVGLLTSIVTHAVIAVFYYGRMAERVMNLHSWVSGLDLKVTDHERRISTLEGASVEARASRLEAMSS